MFFKKSICIALILIAACSLYSFTTGEAQNAKLDTELSKKIYLVDSPGYGLSPIDFEMIYGLCTDFIKEYYSAIEERKNIDLQSYVNHGDLTSYVEKTIEMIKARYPTQVSLWKSEVVYGLQALKWMFKEECAYVSFSVQVYVSKDFAIGSTHEFLVQNQNGRLVIADWHSIGDQEVSGYRAENGPIDDPYIWDDAEWVNDLSSKMEWKDEPGFPLTFWDLFIQGDMRVIEEFRLPSSQMFALEGVDAVLFDWVIEFYRPNYDPAGLYIPLITYIDSFPLEDEVFGIVFKAQYIDYKKLGPIINVAHPRYFLNVGEEQLLRFNLIKREDGTWYLQDFIKIWDPYRDDVEEITREIFGPKTELAQAYIDGEFIKTREITSGNPVHLLEAYMEYYYR